MNHFMIPVMYKNEKKIFEYDGESGSGIFLPLYGSSVLYLEKILPKPSAQQLMTLQKNIPNFSILRPLQYDSLSKDRKLNSNFFFYLEGNNKC